MAAFKARNLGQLIGSVMLIFVFITSQDLFSEGIHHNRGVNMFEHALSNWTFVDKTLLIKDTFESGRVLHMEMPRNCGRTTVLHMLRTFVEHPTDDLGKPLDVVLLNSTTNYHLFVKNKLKICNYSKIFRKHFGLYPVIFIDFFPMQNVSTYEELLSKLKDVIRDSFLEHEYFLRYHNFWKYRDDRHKFQMYSNGNMTEMMILKAFNFLAKMLHIRYRKKVFLLIDNFEEYAEGMVYKTQPNIDFYLYKNITIPKEKLYPFRQNPDAVKAVKFMAELNRRLLIYSLHIAKAFISGLYFVPDLGLFEPLNIESYIYRHNHKFSQYYGMTEEEVMSFIPKIARRRTARILAKYRLDDTLRPEPIIGQNVTLYDLTPTLSFLNVYQTIEFIFPTPSHFAYDTTTKDISMSIS